MNTYLYGIVRWPVPWEAERKRAAARGGRAKKAAAAASTEGPGAGVGDPPRPVETVRHRDLAALVSAVAPGEISGQNVRAMRRDMKAHAAVLNRVVEAGAPSLLPVRYGTVFPNPQSLVQRLLEPQYDLLVSYLERLRGAVEVSLKATYVETNVLREVVAQQPQLARSGARTYQAKIDVGRRVAEALRAKQAHDARWLLDALSPAARDVRVGQPASDLMVLNASFLVEQKALPKFDRVLEKVNAEAGDLMQFDCVGPLPPYSFADLRL